METDLNNKAGSVDQQDLSNAGSVNQQDLDNAGSVDQQDQDGKLADGTDKNKTVKYTDLKKATDRATAAEEQAAHAQRQLELIQANMPQQAQQPQTQVQAKSIAEQALSDLGITADELYGENIVRFQNRKDELERACQQYQTAHAANRQFIASHPDFSTVVGSVNPSTGQIMSWSPEALSLQQKKPYLAAAFQSAEGAYLAVMDERKITQLEQKATVNQEHLNRQVVDNATLPLGGSAAGGGGAGSAQNQAMLTREQTKQIDDDIDAGKYDT